ncbi:hypothetical protein LTR37_010546 [Vermiconidia calcicola]|uniref:Uncharacterized protein n=1 Tax=Vermiconidia calcicola TaxID=1690605 RepID=A0ACC3N4U5_9PEZI|nr:hypothetical protein LTR37_010546 [Vermiconidia calcicola]
MEFRYGLTEFFRECRDIELSELTTPESMKMENYFFVSPKSKRCFVEKGKGTRRRPFHPTLYLITAMPSQYIPYSDVYNDNPADYRESKPYGRVHEVSAEDIDTVRRQQWEAFSRPAAQRLTPQNLEVHRRGTTRQRERSADDAYRQRSRQQRGRRHSPSTRSSSCSSSDDDDEEDDHADDTPQQRRRRDYFRRHGYEKDSRRAKSEQRPDKPYDGDLRSRVTGNLDGSPNGILVGAIGAGIGAIAARRFGSRNHFDEDTGSTTWKTLGGALAGGVVANVAEERFRKSRSAKEEGLK